MRTTVSLKMFLDRPHVIKKIGEGRARALRKAGAMVYRSSQKQFAVRRRRKQTNRIIGRFRGLPLVERRTRTPTPGKITTWPGPRSSGGYMRSMLGFAWDDTSKTVVVGPRKIAWLARLHEFGMTQVQRLYLRYGGRAISYEKATGGKPGRGKPAGAKGKAYVGTFITPAPSAPSFKATAITRTVRVRASEFMAKGLAKVRAKIPATFRGQIRGP